MRIDVRGREIAAFCGAFLPRRSQQIDHPPNTSNCPQPVERNERHTEENHPELNPRKIRGKVVTGIASVHASMLVVQGAMAPIWHQSDPSAPLNRETL
jgi:hypothetical protein